MIPTSSPTGCGAIRSLRGCRCAPPPAMHDQAFGLCAASAVDVWAFGLCCAPAMDDPAFGLCAAATMRVQSFGLRAARCSPKGCSSVAGAWSEVYSPSDTPGRPAMNGCSPKGCSWRRDRRMVSDPVKPAAPAHTTSSPSGCGAQRAVPGGVAALHPRLCTIRPSACALCSAMDDRAFGLCFTPDRRCDERVQPEGPLVHSRGVERSDTPGGWRAWGDAARRAARP
jgi:hypothetical protein